MLRFNRWLISPTNDNTLNYMSKMCIYCWLFRNCTINLISLAHFPSYLTVTYWNKAIQPGPPPCANKTTPTLIVKGYVNWCNTNKYGNHDYSLPDLTIPQHHCNQETQNWKREAPRVGEPFLWRRQNENICESLSGRPQTESGGTCRVTRCGWVERSKHAQGMSTYGEVPIEQTS